jgi:hypothetical protein
VLTNFGIGPLVVATLEGMAALKVEKGRPMSGLDHWLERLYWLAQIALPLLVIWAARIWLRHVQTTSQQIDAALQEAQSMKLLKFLSYVEEPRIQEARKVVMTEIRHQEEAGNNWWENDERLHNAAAQLCRAYDYLGGVIRFDGPDRVGQYFLEQWGETIIRAHEILERFLVFRRTSARRTYEDFTWLSQEARQLQGQAESAGKSSRGNEARGI